MKQKKVFLKKEFIMTSEDLKFLDELPDNLPETRITEKQKIEISRIYYKYISPIDHSDYSLSLVKMEQNEKWPSGPRMKYHEAQRIVLNFLINENRVNGMTLEKATFHFYSAMHCRKACTRLISKVWEVEPKY